ncbi:sigma factor-like helix-turn-helix DNA-binding protein [Paenibacillus koleovorans]|uniref:sigma factor-like helix-turn-helix DNA-binding protein n=1 Tax=Paenibacillus koleovorans TaxID=121608 RepID=UPI000FD77B8C|nr:sigma factor-like helix-turn-helix DNA-binding protein [Paenibacillus koleovorans]
MTWVDKLLREYGAGKSQLVAYRRRLEERKQVAASDELDQEIETVSGMVSDLSYGMEYMRTGRRPGAVRGYDSADAYRYAELQDMDLLPALDLHAPEPVISDEQKLKLVRELLKLSKRERECFLLHAVQGKSWAEVATELNLSKNSVQKYIERARTKVRQAI